MAVKGADLIACGMKPGKELGEILGWLFDLVLQDPTKNQADYLLKKAKERMHFD